MHSLDIRTLSFLAMISSVLLALGLQIVNKVISKDPSLRLWTWGASANGAAFILLALRGAIPDLLSIVLANTLLVAGSVWLYLGNRTFRGLPTTLPWYWFLTAAVAATLAYFTYLTPSLSARIVTLSAAAAVVLFPGAVVLLRRGDGRDRTVRWFVATGFLATSLFLGARAVMTAVAASPGQDLMAILSPIDTLSLVFGIALNLVLGIGLPLLISGRLQQRLIEGEEHARALYRKTPAIMHSIDAEGRLLSVSDLWLTMLGYTEDEVIGRKSSEFLTEESRRLAVEEVLPEFFRTGSCVNVPYQFVRKGGGILDVLLSATAERDSNNDIARSLAVMTDVTARKRTEAALAESELRFRGAFETAAHGMALVSTEGRFIKVNPALCAMIGYSEAELLATDFQTITHPDDLTADLHFVHDLLEGRIETYQMEKRYFHKDGRIVWILLSVSLVRTNEGMPVHFVSQIQNITQSKSDRQQLEHLLAEQRAMLENELIGIVRVRNRKIVWANPAFEIMLGYSPGELNGAPTRQNYSSEEAYLAFGTAAYPVLSAGGIFRAQAEHVRKDGKHIWVDVSGAMLDRESGESLWGFVDLTERRQLEQRVAQNEQRMELALAGADLGLWDLDLSSGQFTHNPRLVTMLGYALGEVQADIRTFASHLHLEDWPQLRSAYFAHLKGDTPHLSVEYRLRHKDGHWVWLLSRGKVVDRDATGRAIRITGTTLDISERKDSETALKAREARLATLIASMQDIVMVLDADGRITEYFYPPMSSCPSIERPEQIPGKTYREVLPADVAGKVEEAITGILTDGNPRTVEYSLTLNGKAYVFQATMSPLLGDRQSSTGFLGVICDVTAERTAQLEIERLARTNALLLDSVGNGVYGVDLHGNMNFINSTALAMLGVTEAESLGRNQHSLFHHHHQDGTPYPIDECPVRLTRLDGQIRHVDNEWFWRKDGGGFPVALTVTPVIENGSQVGAVVIFQDITERKANEARIHDLAFYDPLTKLPNRRLLLDRLGVALPTSARRSNHGAILFLDLDKFKTLNDTKGHEFGDLLLVEVARRLLACIRAEDTVARLGGDEFVVMLEDLNTEFGEAAVQAEVIGEKIRSALSAVYPLPDYSHYCSSSIGICLFKGTEVNVGELLKRADMAMYQAKSAGRNTVRFFQSAS